MTAVPLPDRVDPMKAVLTDEPFSDPDWIFERKLDGIRCIAIKAEQRVRLLSRNDLSLNGRFPEVVEARTVDGSEARSVPRRCTYYVLDGTLELRAAGADHRAGPDTLVSVPPGLEHTLAGAARVLAADTPAP